MSHDCPVVRRGLVFAAPLVGVAIVFAGASGCSKKDESPAPGSSGVQSAPGAPVAAGSAPAAARPRPVALTADPEKVWASGVSLGTGMTATELDSGRIAVGTMSGRGPVVVVFDAKGEGQEARIRLKQELAAEPKKENGKREILRVTPGLGSGNEVVAFVDYREVGDSKRLVACGPSDSNDELLQFEGKPILDAGDDDKGKADEAQKPAPAAPSAKPAAPAPKPAATPSAAKPATAKPAPVPSGAKPAASAAPNPAVPRKPPALSAAKPPASAKPAEPPKPPAPAKPTAPAKTEPEKELRECRTLVDKGGAHAWAVGSELVGKPAADGSMEYSLVFFAEQERGRGRADLANSPLGKAPTKIPVYEAPSAFDIGGGNFVLASRFRGALYSWVLDASKHARGPVRIYAGGFPAQPHLTNLGSEMALLVVQGGPGGQNAARAARFAPDVTSLPSSLTDLVIPERSIEPPVSAAVIPPPSPLAASRFVAYQSDQSVKRLSVVQVDGNLAASAEPLKVDLGVRDSELFALGDGRLLVVYIRVDASGKSELVSKTIRLA